MLSQASPDRSSAGNVNALIKATSLSSGKHKSPHQDLLTDEEKGKDVSNKEAEEDMANPMSAFCCRVSKTPTCYLPSPDSNVSVGNGMKGSILAKRLRQEMAAENQDDKQKLGLASDGLEKRVVLKAMGHTLNGHAWTS